MDLYPKRRAKDDVHFAWFLFGLHSWPPKTRAEFAPKSGAIFSGTPRAHPIVFRTKSAMRRWRDGSWRSVVAKG
eukprot:3865979-Pyramimonas_sp.AAC.1